MKLEYSIYEMLQPFCLTGTRIGTTDLICAIRPCGRAAEPHPCRSERSLYGHRRTAPLPLARCREQHPPVSGRSLASQSQLYAAAGKSAAAPVPLSLWLYLPLRRSSPAQANDRKYIAGINDTHGHYI